MSLFLQTIPRVPASESEFRWEWIIGVNGHGPDGGQAYRLATRVAELYRRSQPDQTAPCEILVLNLPTVRTKVDAMNAMVERATGEWVAVLDVDDTWERNKLLLQWIAATGNAASADVIGTWCWYFGDIVSEGPALPSGWIDPEIFWKGNPIINSSTILRRSLARWDGTWRGLDDYDLWLRLVRRGARFFNIPYRLVHHRIHADSAFNASGQQDVAGLLQAHAALRSKHGSSS